MGKGPHRDVSKYRIMKIVFVGSGNVATHLASALFSAGHDIVGVYSPTYGHAEALAHKVGAQPLSFLENLRNIESDVIIVSTVDSALPDLLSRMPCLPGRFVFHTSGSLLSSAFESVTPYCGVIYPFQTFSKNVEVDISKVPFMIYGRDDATISTARSLAVSLSSSIYVLNDQQRKKLHIAGVFASNFPNFCLKCARESLSGTGLPFEILHPLVNAMVEKAFEVGPFDAQTGPARRGDREVIMDHAYSLPENLGSLYAYLSNEILKTYNK